MGFRGQFAGQQSQAAAVRFGSKEDMRFKKRDVRFTPESGHRLSALWLYLWEHCSICFRVRIAAALKRLHLQETVLLEDDSETMINLVGKRVVPILVKDDGQPMLESMDMVAYIDG